MLKTKNKPRTRTFGSMRGKKVICAMSGGVDSSVAATLLKRAGFNVIGVFMKFWSPLRGSSLINADSNADLRGYNRCCSPEAEARARKVAKILKIPFYVFNFEKEFKKMVVDYFLKEYKRGRTPNPCVVCNKEIKFGLLFKKAMALGADYLATGHYARVKALPAKKTFKDEQNCQSAPVRHSLLKGKDGKKDQSYFLWLLSQGQLKRVLFPLGNYTKSRVYRLANKFKLPFFSLNKSGKNLISESQEICFISGCLNDFLKRRLKPKPGKIVCSKPGSEQKAIGRHQGLPFYTIGQRKGIGLSGGPYFVLDKDIKNNRLLVTKNEKDLYQKEAVIENISWISGKVPKLPLKVKAKIRYQQQPAPAILYPEPKTGNYKLVFHKAQRAITPGQSAVFYDNLEVLGGGVIVPLPRLPLPMLKRPPCRNCNIGNGTCPQRSGNIGSGRPSADIARR